MKELRTREEVLLGIVAGRDIDDKTKQMTPPLGASVTEELMLEIADKVNGDGSSGGSGGGGLYLLTPVLENDQVVGLEQSYNDVKAAFDAGKRIELHNPLYVNDFSGFRVLGLTQILMAPSTTESDFTCALVLSSAGAGELTLTSTDPDAPMSTGGTPK